MSSFVATAVLSATLGLLPAQPAGVTAYDYSSAGSITRSGRPPAAGLTVACPEAWLGDTVFIEGIGMRRCDDTGRWDRWRPAEMCPGIEHLCLPELAGAPHLDLFIAAGAREFGMQRRLVWRFRKTNEFSRKSSDGTATFAGLSTNR